MPDAPRLDHTSPPPPGGPTAPATPGGAKRWPVRAMVVWALRLFVTLALALLFAWAGAVLAVFGLAAVALGIAALLVIATASVRRTAMLPAAVLACALCLPAAAGALGTTRFDRSHGVLHASPKGAADIPRSEYRRGAGPVLVDLRQFHAPDGSSTAILAQADNGNVVVALPRDRCFNLDVDYDERDADTAPVSLAKVGFDLVGLRAANEAGSWGSIGLSDSARNREYRYLQSIPSRQGPYFFGDLLAYGVTPTTEGHWTHRAPNPGAPTLRLHLRAGAQIVVRDYPDFIGPLDQNAYAGETGLIWPEGLQSPPSPGQLAFAGRASVRTRANRAQWVAWERRMVPWAKAQAQRLAGACATRAELRDRVVDFQTQAGTVRDEQGHATELLGGPTTRRSIIPQKPIGAHRQLVVEVNGLGDVRVRDTVPYSVSGDTGADGAAYASGGASS